MPKTLQFYFDLMSPYSYLAATQVEAVVARTSGSLKWRPVYLPGVFKATGNTGPTAVMAKAMYTLKDLNDWAQWLKLRPMVLPSTFPFIAAQADRVALMLDEALVGRFVRHLGARIWHDGADCSQPEVLAEAISAVGADPVATMASAQTQEAKDRLRASTDELVERNGYGVPTFFIGDEMFVGNDRLHFVERAMRP